jgi:hypothetical protein
MQELLEEVTAYALSLGKEDIVELLDKSSSWLSEVVEEELPVLVPLHRAFT